MPRVNFVKRAQKDYPEYGIKKGEPYYWWKFRYGGKHVSKTHPKPSQLTQSDYLSRVYEWQEREAPAEYGDLESTIEELKGELEELRDECDEKFNNMPEGLQQGETGQLLKSRRDSLYNAISSLESINVDDEDAVKQESDDGHDEESESEEERETRHNEALAEKLNELWNEVTDALGEIET